MDAVEQALEACRAHLDRTGSRNSEIETYLVRYLLVRICAERELCIEQMVKSRVDRLGDAPVAQFVMAATDRLLRSLYVSEIKGFLSKFGSGAIAQFPDESNDSAVRRWNDIVANRHAVGHATSAVNLTLDELTERYIGSQSILDCIGRCLGL